MSAPNDTATLFRDFCRFSKLQLASGDVDSSYPLLKRVYALDESPCDVALWRSLLFVAWCCHDSAEKVWQRYPQQARVSALDVPILATGKERRGFRGAQGVPRVTQFVNAVVAASSSALCLWTLSLTHGRSPEEGWREVYRAMLALPYAGPWAAYKWADILRNVHGIPIAAPDFGGGGSETTGPAAAMSRLTGHPWQECLGIPRLQHELLDRARNAGVPFEGIDTLETCLCNFQSLLKGWYYSGQDIDEVQSELARAGMSATWWESRAVYPDAYRGELMGWSGVRPHLKKLYRDKGVIYSPPGFAP